MKKLLFVYPSMGVGGSTTSLLSLLNELDYSKYSVDMLMFQEPGKLANEIPSQVNILPAAYRSMVPFKLRKRMSIHCWKAVLTSKIPLQRSQLIAQASAKFCRSLDNEYDVAVAFLECWPLYYLSTKVNAKKKVCWIHVNYKEASFEPDFDRYYVKKMDKFVLVSDSCAENFKICFPEIAERVETIPNILSSKTVRNRSLESVCEIDWLRYKETIKFISVCRLDCSHKGLDRAIKAFKRIVDNFNGVLPRNFVWFIIGGGKDEEMLRKMIENFSLNKYILMLGEKMNPLVYVRNCDVFLLPSRYEGKPMAVTEAQMLGLVLAVTNYSSAHEQIRHQIDGIIAENNDEAIYEMLKEFISGEVKIEKLKECAISSDYSNLSDMMRVNRILEGSI